MTSKDATNSPKEKKIARLDAFKALVEQWVTSHDTSLRGRINREKEWVQREVIEAGCIKVMTISPPRAVGGLVMQNVNPFDVLFNPPWRINIARVVIDMVESTIGVLSAEPDPEEATLRATVDSEIVLNYAFVAMPMDAADPALPDVLDAVKEAARRCGVTAERVDDPDTNERITDRMLESIRRAEFVIADLTNSKPNVYYEAGYAHALGKIPIYIAREGTKLEFDLKDYPVIFFRNYKQLKDDLEKRLRGLPKKHRR